MSRTFPMQRLLCAAALALAAAHAAADVITSVEMTQIEQLTGLKGSYSKAEDVYKVVKPRSYVKVRVEGRHMPPFMGLASWAAFTPADHGQFMLMGDTALFEDEVNPVLSVALDAGLDVTALHNHFLFDQPKVYFMHVAGTGKLDALASGVAKMYARVDEIRRAQPEPVAVLPGMIARKNSISAAPLEAIFDANGTASEGMFKVVFGRSVRMHGVKIGKEMGVNTWAAFAGSDEQAVVDGDVVMTADELQPVLKSLRASGINIVAIHQHMVGEEPDLLFLHYWGKGRARALAEAVKQAIGHTKLD